MDHSSYQLICLFLTYAFLGWLGETALAAARKGRLINRGFLNAPFSPVYGLAGVLFALFLPELKEAPFFLFLFGMILATALELATGVLLEQIFRQKWWDYSNERWNFQGYICLKYSLIWGLLAVLCLFLFNPILLRLITWIPRPVGNLLVLLLILLLSVDFLSSWAALVQLNGAIKEPSEISRRWKKLSDALDNAVTRSIQRRMARAYPSLEKERIRTQRKAAPVRDTSVFAAGCSFYKLVCLFCIGAFLGDIIETIFCRVTAGVWMSRSSVVYGPFSIVWGLGAVLLTAVLYRYRERSDSFVFLFGTVLGGAYEYICSVFTELAFGTVFWDYSHLPFNLGGRINLLFCFFWGIAAVLWLKLCYPRLSNLIERLPIRTGKTLSWCFLIFMTVNVLVSALALGRYTQRHTQPPPLPLLSVFSWINNFRTSAWNTFIQTLSLSIDLWPLRGLFFMESTYVLPMLPPKSQSNLRKAPRAPHNVCA